MFALDELRVNYKKKKNTHTQSLTYLSDIYVSD